MKRILQLSYSLALAGTETVIMNWYRNIDRNKVQFDFVSVTEENLYFKDEIEKLGGKIFIIKKEKGIFGILKFYFNLFKLIKSNKWYAFHTHTYYLSGMDCMIAWLAGVKNRITISHFSAGLGHLIQTPLYKKLFSRLSIKLFSTKNLAVSNDAGKTLYGSYIKFKMLPNGIETEKFKFDKEKRIKIRKELNLEDKFVIGNVGRFAEQKNHSFLIRIFNEIYMQDKNSILLLIGDGVLKTQIKKQVENLNLKDKVIFLGTRKDVSNIYQAMDILIMPSLYEGLPVVGVETQCSGLPFFISDGVPTETVICNTTKISLSKSAKDWADIILEKTRNFKRKDCSEFIKKAGFDIRDVVKQIEQIYLEE